MSLKATTMSTTDLSFEEELNSILGTSDSPIPLNRTIETLQRLAWTGRMSSMKLRPLCWRLLLGVIPTNCPIESWASRLKSKAEEYAVVKAAEFPQMDRVSADPLSAYSEDKESEEWKKFYKDVELCNFISVDLDRLYLHGIEDEYFQTRERREILTSVLFVWSARHSRISYRQGMHEIVGPILFSLENEIDALSQADLPSNHPLNQCFTRALLESNVFWIFERVMSELDFLYDPNAPISKGPEALPGIVSFCAKVQEHFLRDLDPELCTHLEESFIQSQLYGMRWCRLLFGREIEFSPNLCFRVWDYLFACCAITPNNYYQYKPDFKYEFAETGHGSSVASPGSNKKFFTPELEAGIAKKAEYSPLIAAIADMMLAMLLQIRTELVEGDSNSTMMLVMHYPEVKDVTPILDLADMIRRGVLRTGAHMGQDLSTTDSVSYQFQSNTRFGNMKQPPAWLNSLRPSSIVGNVNSMTQKVAGRFSSRTASSGGAGSASHAPSTNFDAPTSKIDSSSQQTVSGSVEQSPSLLDLDDPLSALLTPATNFVADASANISMLASMSFPYLSSGGQSTEGEELVSRQTREASVGFAQDDYSRDDPLVTSSKLRALQTPTPMTKSKGLTPVTGDAKIRRPENWSGGVDLPTISKSISFADALTNDKEERNNAIAQRLVALAHSIPAKCHDDGSLPARGALTSEEATFLYNSMLALAEVVNGSKSVFDYDSLLEVRKTEPATDHGKIDTAKSDPLISTLPIAATATRSNQVEPKVLPTASNQPVMNSDRKSMSNSSSLLDSLLSGGSGGTSTTTGPFMTSFDEARAKHSRNADLFS